MGLFMMKFSFSQNGLFAGALAVVFAWGLLATQSSAGAGVNVIAWGAGTISNTADGPDYGQSEVPGNLTNAVQVAGGEWHSLALKADGTLEGWGDNGAHELVIPDYSNYVAIACGAHFSLALQSSGTVVASLGDDSFGQTEVPDGLTNIVAIACGYYHGVALQSDGTVVAWGANGPMGEIDFGQTIVPDGVTNVVAIAAGGYHTLALEANGTLAEWGDQTTAGIPPGLSNVVAIATGAEHNIALLASGYVVAWGINTYGQTDIPVGLSNVVAIAAGGWHTLALKTNGTVVAWGAGVGSNANVDFNQTVVPVGLSNVVQVTGGLYNSLALKGTGPPTLKAPLTANGLGTNGFEIALPTRNGRVYQLEYVNSLTNQASQEWMTLPLQFGTGGTIQLNDPSAAASSQRFYQVIRW